MCDRRAVGVIFDGSFEAFLCVIHDFYYKKLLPADIVCETMFQQRLGMDYRRVEADSDNAAAVADGIRKKISEECFENLYSAFLNKDESKYMDLFRYIVAGFKIGREIDRYEQWQSVRQTHKYARNTRNEAHYFIEFIRFKDTKNGVLYARIEPESHVLPLIADHFASRLISERWMIHDVNRRLAVVYDTNEWAIYETPAHAVVEISDTEEQFQDLWIAFFNAIAVKERISHKRQRGMLPLRYRTNMPEFKR